ncbi:MAG TPA: hypothetical protein VGN72_09625 [Tepidisphaeraceae bacterium]|nr:hypothetical protein [Tepidisphaeraceae bacterium]
MLKAAKLSRGLFIAKAADHYFQLGNINERRAETELAIRAYRKAKRYANEAKNRRVIKGIEAKLAILGMRDGPVPTALKSYRQAKSNHGKYSEECATKANNLALAYLAGKAFEAAKVEFREAIEILEALNILDQIKLAMAYINLGSLYEELNQFEHADAFFHKAFDRLNPEQTPLAFNVMLNAIRRNAVRGHTSRAREWFG